MSADWFSYCCACKYTITGMLSCAHTSWLVTARLGAPAIKVACSSRLEPRACRLPCSCEHSARRRDQGLADGAGAAWSRAAGRLSAQARLPAQAAARSACARAACRAKTMHNGPASPTRDHAGGWACRWSYAWHAWSMPVRRTSAAASAGAAAAPTRAAHAMRAVRALNAPLQGVAKVLWRSLAPLHRRE